MIHVENLTKYYHDLCAVDTINLEIEKGEVLGLLGPNGAGKTTTLRMLTGFLRPSSGTIRVKDYTIEEDALKIKRLLGYLPESAPLYHEMLVYDYLVYIANIKGLEKTGNGKLSLIRNLADLCGLNEIMHKPIGELSKGYKQRVGLAHAMMNEPEILVLDEPTSGLDPNQIAEIRQIIRRIGKEKTIIISTHILSEAEAACDRIVIINRGKIVADDRTESLKQTASKEHFIHISISNADFQSARAQLEVIDGISKVECLQEDQDGVIDIRLTCNASYDLRGSVYQTVKKTDWALMELHQETRTLENIFRELTKEE